MGKPCQNLRAKWDDEAMENCMRAVERGMSQRKASERFNVPRRTLRNHLKTGSNIRKLGRGSVLTKQQEKDLVTRIMRLAEVGYPVTPKIARHQVFRFCEANNIPHKFQIEKETAGKAWFKLFRKRNPELSIRKAQNMNPAMAQKLNKFIVNDYFTKLESILDEMDLKNKPERIFNMDEKGCWLTLHHQQIVLAKKGVKRLHLVASEHAQNVTVVGCVSAIGSAIPPMVIFKGKRLKPEFLDNLPAGTTVKMAPKGSMTTELFIDFVQHLAKFKLPGSILLIFDGAACHLDYEIVEAADQHAIKLLCLPSNTTHELQPLDKSVYRSFESHWDQEVLRYWDQHPDRVITKPRFNIIFSKVWSKRMTQENIISGFKATGIFPFNPSTIPEAAFAPSIPSSLHQARIDEDDDDDDDENIPLARVAENTRQSQEENNKQTNTDGSRELNVSFHELLETPNKLDDKPKAPRKKSINYKAQLVTRAVFIENLTDNVPSTSKAPIKQTTSTKSLPTSSSVPSTSKILSVKLTPITKSVPSSRSVAGKQITDSKKCFLCDSCRVIDMRTCRSCKEWVHDECIGLTLSDDEEFECPKCEK
ncbi:hypothetical protein NQ314_010378 [Rhamnusium bicolor]|uniref:PHD-type domain-containing protein n=1 Tax=Rhamnusium bicolor TaxID=1586634 RepID=A0AAV8XSH6_9CUCU|nr:hypothetical protein NQ314_010378 [Rhamnusium bicolor]